jgi:hypothetical protein
MAKETLAEDEIGRRQQRQQRQHHHQQRALDEHDSSSALVEAQQQQKSAVWKSIIREKKGQIVFASFVPETSTRKRRVKLVRKSCGKQQTSSPSPSVHETRNRQYTFSSPHPQQQQQQQQHLELEALKPPPSPLYSYPHHQAPHHHRGKVAAGAVFTLDNSSKQHDDSSTIATAEDTTTGCSSSLSFISRNSSRSGSSGNDSLLVVHDLSMFATMLVSEELQEENQQHHQQQQQQYPISNTHLMTTTTATNRKSRPCRRRRGREVDDFAPPPSTRASSSSSSLSPPLLFPLPPLPLHVAINRGGGTTTKPQTSSSSLVSRTTTTRSMLAQQQQQQQDTTNNTMAENETTRHSSSRSSRRREAATEPSRGGGGGGELVGSSASETRTTSSKRHTREEEQHHHHHLTQQTKSSSAGAGHDGRYCPSSLSKAMQETAASAAAGEQSPVVEESASAAAADSTSRSVGSSSCLSTSTALVRSRSGNGNNDNDRNDQLVCIQSSSTQPSPPGLMQQSLVLATTPNENDGVGRGCLTTLLLSPSCMVELQTNNHRTMENTSPLSTSWCDEQELDESYDILLDNNGGGVAADGGSGEHGGGGEAADHWTPLMEPPPFLIGSATECSGGGGSGMRRYKRRTTTRSLDQRRLRTLLPPPTLAGRRDEDDDENDDDNDGDNDHNDDHNEVDFDDHDDDIGRLHNVTKQRREEGFRSSGRGDDDGGGDRGKAEFPRNDSFKENSPSTQQSSRRRRNNVGDSANQTHVQTKQQQRTTTRGDKDASMDDSGARNQCSINDSGFVADGSFDDIDDSDMLRLMAQGTESIDSAMYSSAAGVVSTSTSLPAPTSITVSGAATSTTTTSCANNSSTSRRQQREWQRLRDGRKSLEEEMPELEFALESFAQEAYFDWRNDTLESTDIDCEDGGGDTSCNMKSHSEGVALRRGHRPPSRTDASTLLLPTPSLRDEIQQESQLGSRNHRREGVATSVRNIHSVAKGKPKPRLAGEDFSPDSTSSDLQVWDLDSDDAIDNAGNVDWHRLDGPPLLSSPTSSVSSGSLISEEEPKPTGRRRRSRTDACTLLLPTPSLREELDVGLDTAVTRESSATEAKSHNRVPPAAAAPTLHIRTVDFDDKKEHNQNETNTPRSLSRSLSKGSDRTFDLELECSRSIVKFNERSVLQPIAEEPVVHASEGERTTWRAQVDDLLLKNRQLEERLERLTYDTRIKIFQDTFDELRLVKIKNEQLQQQVDSLRHVQIENVRLEQQQAMQTALVAEMAEKFVNIQNFTQTLQTKLQVSEQRNKELEQELARLSS